MVAQHYRWDFVGLSTDEKPTPETSEKVVNGSTFYCSDTSKLYVFCDNTWYERKPLGGGGGGGGSYTAGNGIDITDDTISVDTDTIQEKLTAGSNVSISDNTISATDTTYSAGTGLNLTGTEFSADTTVLATQNDLSGKQNTLTAGSNITISDNTISATDTTYSDFTGTDGTAAGSAGLVPAPATTDAGKFLKADGTWDTAGGGGSGAGFVELTSADYNYPVATPTGIHPMYLADGAYKLPKGLVFWGISSASTTPYSETLTTDMYLVVSQVSANDKRTYYVYPGGAGTGDFRGSHLTVGLRGRANQSEYIKSYNTAFSQDIVDNLTSTSIVYPLSANQGKVLKGLIDAISQSGAGAPTTSTVGTVGQLYQDTTNGKLYICTDATNPYVWEEVGAGGGSITELTSADYDYPTSGTATSIALWLLPDGLYTVSNGPVNLTVSTGTSIAATEGCLVNVSTVSDGTDRKIIYTGAYGSTLYTTTTSGSAVGDPAPYMKGTIAQNTGNSTASVMSQRATTSMVFADPSTKQKVKIGDYANASGNYSVAIGGYNNGQAIASGNYALAIGGESTASGPASIAMNGGKAQSTASIALKGTTDATAPGAVAIGVGAVASAKGQFDIGAGASGANYGYNSSAYRLLTGLYDGQSAHDAATVAQGNTLATSAPTTATVGVLGQLYTDTTNMHTYQCTAIDTTDPSNPSYTWTQRW